MARFVYRKSGDDEDYSKAIEEYHGTRKHLVWRKRPFNEPEVYDKYRTRKDAERVAKVLTKRYARQDAQSGHGLKSSVWIESPGSIEEKLREMYEEG